MSEKKENPTVPPKPVTPSGPTKRVVNEAYTKPTDVKKPDPPKE